MTRKSNTEARAALRAEIIAHQLHEFDMKIAEWRETIQEAEAEVRNLKRHRDGCSTQAGAHAYDLRIARRLRSIDADKAAVNVFAEMREALLKINTVKPRRGMYYCPQLRRSVWIPGGDHA